MVSDKAKLENYLSRLEKGLGQIPISDRSEIILEIKSHVLDSKEKHPEARVADILSGLGEPETVANKYLLERGLKLGKAPKSPIVKWLTIGFLGTLGISVLTGLILIWKFTPIVSINGDDGKVSILGGLIAIDDDSGVDVFSWDSETTSEFKKSFGDSGDLKISAEVKRVKVLFTNAKVEFSWHADDVVQWNCKFLGLKDKDIASFVNDEVILSFKQASKCQISLPNLPLQVVGANGKIELLKPMSDYEIELTNGITKITPDHAVIYDYDLKVTNGTIGSFPSTKKSSNSKLAKITIVNGKIVND